jgi:hypothetical protein
MNALGQLDIGQAAIPLQFSEDLQVGAVEVHYAFTLII